MVLMGNDLALLQRRFDQISFKAKRDIAIAVQTEANRLAEAIKAAAPVGETGALRDSVQVRRKRGELTLQVTAGGDATTKEIRKGSGEPYDYALAVEYGTTDAHAEPFFYPTVRAMQDEIRGNLIAAVERAFR